MLYTGCILDKHLGKHRISIMSRHTQDDGVTPDERLNGKYDEHIPQLAPRPRTVGSWYRGEIEWRELKRRYLVQINSPTELGIIGGIVERSRTEEIILLCKEESPERCHRGILAEFIERKYPDLEVFIG